MRQHLFILAMATLFMTASAPFVSADCDNSSLFVGYSNILPANSEVKTAENLTGTKNPINESLARQKSPGAAFLLSAAVPGTGQFYSGAKRGVLFVATEIAFWTTYFVMHGRAEQLQDGYIKYVDSHIAFESDSPAQSTRSWTLEDYEHATQSDNWHYVYTETDGKPLKRVGKFYWDDLPKEKIDEQGTELVSKHRAEAYNKRMSANEKFKQAKICLGLVVLNHIVSAVDGRIAAINRNKRVSEANIKISFLPVMSPSGQPGACLTLHKRF